jgi:hypothetical protein
MAKLLANKTGCLEAGQKRCEELTAIFWIKLRINGSRRRGLKERSLIRCSLIVFPFLILMVCPIGSESAHAASTVPFFGKMTFLAVLQ